MTEKHTAEPRRIQRKRTKGWRMPENTVYVGRPSVWGNPFKVGHCFEHGLYCGLVFDNDHAYRLFKRFLPCPSTRELRGKNLACWCPLDQPCHADILLEMANG